MTTDHHDQVEELLADYRRSREQLASVQRDLAAASGSATSPDGAVTATVGSHGTLTALVLSDDAYQRHRPQQLADLVLRTAELAAARAADSAHRVLAPVLPSGTDPEALLRGTADLRPEEITPLGTAPLHGSVPREEDEDYEQRESWLDSETTQRRGR
ncbi:YbaB/EbfC family nucleoid-associated protein [Umezawaea beigongshangensis]|uniref:YbaB/EbfC family nucleoid-associated protein n=1 Tax=Umezawaea beigongshangensis TaxID=2780383 RepID=UPI0018F12D82|nr:YbaB/EbfC family nucleoid-associated protein [Umezawaea beigongshangensis]